MQRQNLTSFLSKVRSRATRLFPEGGGEGTDATRERLDALLVVLQDRAADTSIDENALLSRFREANPELANEEGLFNVIGDLSDEIGIGRDELERIRNSAKAVINGRFTTSSVTAGAAELYAYGTAVVLIQSGASAPMGE